MWRSAKLRMAVFHRDRHASARNLYVYLNAPGEGWIDDLMLVAGTNAGAGVT